MRKLDRYSNYIGVRSFVLNGAPFKISSSIDEFGVWIRRIVAVSRVSAGGGLLAVAAWRCLRDEIREGVRIDCLAEQEALAVMAPRVQPDVLGSVRSGVNGTPTFFVNGIRHDSPYGYADLPSVTDQAVMAAAA